MEKVGHFPNKLNVKTLMTNTRNTGYKHRKKVMKKFPDDVMLGNCDPPHPSFDIVSVMTDSD